MCSQMHPLSSPPPSSFSSSLTDLIVAWPGFSLIPAWGKGGGSLNLKGEGGDLSDEREKASLFQGVIIRLSHQMCDGPVLHSKRLFKCRRVHCQSRCDQIFLPAASFLQKWRNECYHQGSFYFSTGFMFDCVPACGTLLHTEWCLTIMLRITFTLTVSLPLILECGAILSVYLLLCFIRVSFSLPCQPTADERRGPRPHSMVRSFTMPSSQRPLSVASVTSISSDNSPSRPGSDG